MLHSGFSWFDVLLKMHMRRHGLKSWEDLQFHSLFFSILASNSFAPFPASLQEKEAIPSCPSSLRILNAITTVQKAKAPGEKLYFKSKIPPRQILFWALQSWSSPSPQSHQWDWSTSAAFGLKPKCFPHALVAHIAFSQVPLPQYWQIPAVPLPLNFKDNWKYQCFGPFFLQMNTSLSKHLKWKRCQDSNTSYWGMISLLHPVKQVKLIVTTKSQK